MKLTREATPFLALPAALCLVATGCQGGLLGAQDDYPNRPIDWIVPYDPGGASDQQIRRIQEHLQENLGEDINISYQPGGDGAAGWQQLASASPDGYTIANVVTPNAILTDGTGYEVTDFEYVTWTETTPMVLAVTEDSRFEDLEDFVDEAQESPDSISVAGIGQPSELALAEFTEASGVEVTYVPVSGGAGPIVTDMQGGHVDASFISATHVAAHGDSLRGLALSGDESTEALDGIPSFDELGYSGVTQTQMWGVALPPETPEDVVNALNEAVNESVGDPEVQEQIAADGLDPVQQSPEEAHEALEEQIQNVEEARDLLE